MNNPAPTAPALIVDGLRFAYPQHPPILHDLSFTVQAGERVGFIGLNGSGKTTLFLLLCGILKPTAGHIVLFDRPLTVGEFRPDIGMVFQNPDDQLFCPTVRDDVAFGPLNMGLSPNEVATRVADALDLTGTTAWQDRAPHHLSGGEKRMVAIAGILAMRPRLVIYDEPDANLDHRARRRLITFLQAAQETILLASHDLDSIQAVCNRVILLHEGHIAADGPASAIIGNK